MKKALFRSKKHNMEFFISNKSALFMLKINNYAIDVLKYMKSNVISEVKKGKGITEKERENLKRWSEQIKDIKEEIIWI